MAKTAAIIIGANSRLGSALCQQWLLDADIDAVIGVSRKTIKQQTSTTDDKETIFHSLVCDYSEASMLSSCKQIKEIIQQYQLDHISRVCICNGILHNENVWPEKRIEEFDSRTIIEVLTINTIIPILWLKALLSIVK